MKNIHYWLLLQIAKYPKAFIYGVGVLMAVTLTLATAATVLWVDKSSISERHDKAMDMARAMLSESTALLDHLATHDKLSCNQQGLIHLNAHLLKSRYLREIGMMDDDRRLICSTALGLLPNPVKGNYPVITSRSGLQLINNVPLEMADKRIKATLIQYKRFNVVFSPYVTDDLYSSADAVWMRTADGLALLGSSKTPDEIRHMRDRAILFKKTAFTFHNLGYELVTIHPQIDLVMQTQRDLTQIMQQNSVLLFCMLLGSVLIAVLTVGVLAPYIATLSSVRNRVRFLCDDAHLLLAYQPVFDLATMKPVGCEVLMRLREGANLWMPDQVIPAILNSGLACQLDYTVTRKAIRELAAHLPAQVAPFQLALNYFPESVDQAALIPILKNALQAAARNDIEICVEVTEHSLSSELIAEVRSLKEQGFQIAIDDFGTGYSNLNSVKKLSPDVLKIDKSFVFELEDATVRSNLIQEIVNIARAVGAVAVAEGIENPEQARLLAALGVRYGQGHALAYPMELEPFLAFMRKFS